jgi:hypothetical protein
MHLPFFGRRRTLPRLVRRRHVPFPPCRVESECRAAITRWRLVRDMAKMTERKARTTIRGIAPAFIDPPGVYDSLDAWLTFRAEMMELQLLRHAAYRAIHSPNRSPDRSPTGRAGLTQGFGFATPSEPVAPARLRATPEPADCACPARTARTRSWLLPQLREWVSTLPQTRNTLDPQCSRPPHFLCRCVVRNWYASWCRHRLETLGSAGSL